MHFPMITPMRARLHGNQACHRSRRVHVAGLLELVRELAALAGLAGWVALWFHAAAMLVVGNGA